MIFLESEHCAFIKSSSKFLPDDTALSTVSMKVQDTGQGHISVSDWEVEKNIEKQKFIDIF